MVFGLDDSVAAVSAVWGVTSPVIATFRILIFVEEFGLVLARSTGEPVPLLSPDTRLLPDEPIVRLFRVSFGECG